MDGWQNKTGDFAAAPEHWECVETEDGRRLKSLISATIWENNSLAKGDISWKDYTVKTEIEFLDKGDGWGGAVGLIFRFLDCTRFYTAVIDKDGQAKILKSEATNNWDVLAHTPINVSPGDKVSFEVSLKGTTIEAKIGDVVLSAKDDQYPTGMIGFLGAQPALFGKIEVSCSEKEKSRLDKQKEKEKKSLLRKRKKAGQPVLFREISTKGFGSARRIRLGDLTGNQKIDFVHTRISPNRGTGVGSIVAQSWEGEVLWQRGALPPIPVPETSGDVPVQVHDIDGDGKNEVICVMNREILILDGKTGEVKKSKPVPKPLCVSDEYKRCVGNWGASYDDDNGVFPSGAITCVDFRGLGRRNDIVLSGSQHQTMAFDNELNFLWQGIYCHGHFPIPYRPRGADRDNLLNGHHHLDYTGKAIGRICMQDHQDAIFAGPLDENGTGADQILMSGGEDGLLHMTPSYHIRQRHMGHVQRLSIGKFRKDIPGQCIATVLFHGHRGVVSLYDSSVKRLWTRDFPVIGATLQPVLFDASGEERMLLSGLRPAGGYEGGLLDGYGDMVAPFPDDGGPGLCAFAHDFDGDGLDEIMLWDHDRICLYHSDKKPRKNKLLKRVRPPLYNMSNFQSYYSLPKGAIEEL
jgi:hypothetical protein